MTYGSDPRPDSVAGPAAGKDAPSAPRHAAAPQAYPPVGAPPSWAAPATTWPTPPAGRAAASPTAAGDRYRLYRRRAVLRRATTRVAGLNTSRDTREYLELHRKLTTAVSSSRRIVVLSTYPAQGCTTVAALLTIALATRRADPVLVADAAAISPAPLHRVFGAAAVRPIRDLAADPPRITSRGQFGRHLTSVGRDMWLVPSGELVGPSGSQAPDAATYSAAVDPFVRYFDISITDLGCAPGAGTAELLLERAHALCLVTTATREGLAAVTTRLQQLRQDRGTSWAGRTLVVVNSPAPGGARPLRRVGARGVPLLRLGWDPALRPGFPGELSSLAPETQFAAMRLAARVLDTAAPGVAAS